MKILLFQWAMLSLLSNAFGQISGKLTTADGQPIPFANVLLLKSTDSTLIKGTLTDHQGLFQIDNTGAGNYRLKCSSVGYQTWHSSVFELTTEQRLKDFGTQIMKEDTRQLGEIIIKAEKPLFQQEIYGTVVNVESSIMSKGSSVLQVLERSPGVVIDHRNNSIALNGKSGVMVMLNGRLMRMPAEQVTNLLNSMSANDISTIELLTTPPAGYDAEGSAGMINIVLKKNKRQGTNGTVSLTAGYGWGEKGTGSMNIAHNKEKIDFYGSYSFFHERTYSFMYGESTQNFPALGGQLNVKFWNTSKPVLNNHDAKIGFDFRINPKTTIGANINYNNSLMSVTNINPREMTVLPDSLLLFNGIIHGTNRWHNLINSFYLERKMKEGEKISFDLDYLHYRNSNPTEAQTSIINKAGNQVGTDNPLFASLQNSSANTTIQVGVLKIDYARQLSKKVKFETGLKGAYTRNLSLSGIKSQVNGEWIVRSETTNDILMKEGIGAMYASFNAQINASVNLIIGARYEYSHTRMNNAHTGINTIDRKFSNLFPNVFFSKKPNEHTDLQISYTTRISRPSYNDLSSFVAYNDPLSVFTGNPLLRPTITNNLKLGYNYRGYSFSILVSRDNYPIARYQITPSPSRDLMYISPQNLIYQNNLTFQTNIPIQVNNWWNMTYSFAGGWRKYKADYSIRPFEKTYMGYSANFNQSFKLPESFSIEVSGWYNSAWYNGTIKNEGVGTINAGIKKELAHNKGTFQLSIADIFKSINYRNKYGTITEEAFAGASHVSFNPESRKSQIIKLTYAKSFGSSQTKVQTKENTGSQEERERVRRN